MSGFANSLSYSSLVVLIEILEVLQRPEITSKFSPLITLDYERILDLLSRAEVVELDTIPNVSRDVKDNKFLATALSVKADYLISEDEDLLVLKEFHKTKIITCRTFADMLTEY